LEDFEVVYVRKYIFALEFKAALISKWENFFNLQYPMVRKIIWLKFCSN